MLRSSVVRSGLLGTGHAAPMYRHAEVQLGEQYGYAEYARDAHALIDAVDNEVLFFASIADASKAIVNSASG